MKTSHMLLVAVLCSAAFGTATLAADALPPADQSQPVTTPRIGGSPADAAFRDAQRKSGDEYRDSRAACRAKPRSERSACYGAARAALKQTRRQAKVAHDAAKRDTATKPH
jgi:hypothetical protein